MVFLLYNIASIAFSAIKFIFIASIVMSWLVAFGIVSISNPNVRQTQYWLHRLTEPVLGPIRRILPSIGGIDFSPVVVFLALQYLIEPTVYRAIFSLQL